MATNEPVNEFHQYDFVATEITDTFNTLIEQLIARRDALLTKLQTIKEDFVTKETTRIAAIAELERVTQQMKEASIKVNVNLETQEKAIQLYQDQLERHQTPTKLPHPFFSYPTLLHLQTQIAEFGEVREWELNYSLKKQPVLTVGKNGNANDELNNPRGLALDEPNQLIYIADSYNSRIQVVSFAGKFLERFGQGILEEPYGIAVTEDNVFVTDYNLSALLQFCKKDYQLVRRTGTEGGGEGQLDYPRGLCIDYNTDVYVADYFNNRVSVFSKDLKFLNCLYTQQLKYPNDVKVTLSCIVVLDSSPNCIHFFSRSGYLIRSCVTQGEDGMVSDPEFFCLDPAGNILITDYYRNSIKILSPSGQLIHEIGKHGHGRGELIYPFVLIPLQTEAPPIYHVTHDYYELHDPTPSIHQLFTQFDQLFFYSKLGSVSVEWSNKMTSCAGVTYYKPDSHFCYIRLSRPILSLRPRKDLVETLLHEMIHSFLFVAQNNRDHTDHGSHFRSHQTRINTLVNCNITIYHSFHDEVYSLKKHWWRCVGQCRYKHPYYGFVKRAVCRPPSKSDPWWGTHLLTCGGEFEKIRSPDKPVKSVNKTTTATTTTPKKQVDDKQGKLNFKPIKLEDSYLDLNCEYFTPPNSPIVISSPDSETGTETKQLTEAVTPKQLMKLKQCYFCAGFFEMALFENHFTNCICYFP